MTAPPAITFSEFMAARWAPLYRTAYLLTGDRHDAEDLLQAALAGPACVGLDPRQARGRRLRAAGDGAPDVAPVEKGGARW